MYPLKTALRSTVDAGLQKFLMGIYSYMALGLGLTGVVGFAINVAPPNIRHFFHSISMVVGFLTLGLVWAMGSRVGQATVQRAQTLFWIYAGLVGVSLSAFFYQFSVHAISRAFFITAFMFGGASAFGYLTKKDLTRMGSFLFMGVLGLCIASIVNIFLKSSITEFAVSVLGVVIFTGLTAYDTQALKDLYFQLPLDASIRERASIMGALSLYLDVLNIFLYMLRLGDKD
ncbi:Bax inhibitor-1/YccA family protein [Holospora curviuscula]|uniref:Inner membrane protein YbhL n=1 Tax=Holospora curviuscula TaxID=1082868 RepID=A0A2S5RI99_9PROT|nr:Bax inhibitor-1/YccA family protein [Holospora curviuscula]PPE06952.1 Inner membrane protein YbhL [Holospora curviuscula]